MGGMTGRRLGNFACACASSVPLSRIDLGRDIWIGPITIKFYLTHINYLLSGEPIMHIRRGGKNNSIV
eukprot:SAG11_NODE_3448_length_2441_cov_3.742101_2_plen_68_part_00